MTKYLQLRAHQLRCEHLTDNRQNFLGISLENDPDSIDLAGVIVDSQHGMVEQAPPVFLGNHYLTGTGESFSPPKVIAEAPIAETDQFPRQVLVNLNMAEKDDGGGFLEFLGRLGDELASGLSARVGDAIHLDDAALDRAVDGAVAQLLGSIFDAFIQALGLSDDPFRPVTVSCELASFAASPPSGLSQVEFHEPNPQHHGTFVLTYDWHVSPTRAIVASTPASAGAGDVGGASGALTSSSPYPAPYRGVRFRAPKPPVAHPAARLLQVRLPSGMRPWLATPVRLLGAKAKVKPRAR